MSYYLKTDDVLWPTKQGHFDVRNSLPVGTYTVGKSPEKGWYLKAITEFNISGKIYGDTAVRADRILNTFNHRPNTTGVLLNGEKGSGKTMLARMISQKAAEQGIPTLIINTPFCGDSFNTFIQEIDEPCVIVFDEFEKVFDEKEQEGILTLLDGVYPTKKLFVLTVNDKYRINTHMRNRPGRIFYSIEYKGLCTEFIEEYCNDCLNDKKYIPQIVRITSMFESFNFDMLKALVEEMNRYNESPNQALEMLNAKPYDDKHSKHHVAVFMDGKEIDSNHVWPSTINGTPLSRDSLDFRVDSKPEDLDSECIEFEITAQDLKNIDPDAGTFTYVINEGKPEATILVFTRENKSRSSYNWLDAF